MNLFNAIKFYNDYRISWTDVGPKSTRGWIQTKCPFCHSSGNHLGFHVATGAYHCWKCGNKGAASVIMAMLNIDFPMAKELLDDYSQNNRATRYNKEATEKVAGKANKVCTLPLGTEPLTARHKAYLEKRGFDANQLEEAWGIKGTGNIGDYKFRIIAPIVVEGRVVSYQGRDVTGKAPLRYKACKKEDEIIEHQTVVYGGDHVTGDTCLVVEGITDVWRMGYGSVSCFGTAFTLDQVNFLADRFRVVYVLFDCDDSNAIKMANELGCLLSARGVEVEVLDISDTPLDCLVDPKKGIDPGNLKDSYAKSIMKEIGLL